MEGEELMVFMYRSLGFHAPGAIVRRARLVVHFQVAGTGLLSHSLGVHMGHMEWRFW